MAQTQQTFKNTVWKIEIWFSYNVHVSRGEITLTFVRTEHSSMWSLWLAVEAPGDGCRRCSSASTACSLNSICFKASAGPGCFHTLLSWSLRRTWAWVRQQRGETDWLILEASEFVCHQGRWWRNHDNGWLVGALPSEDLLSCTWDPPSVNASVSPPAAAPRSLHK